MILMPVNYTGDCLACLSSVGTVEVKTEEDRKIKSNILDLACKGTLSLEKIEEQELNRDQWEELSEMTDEGLISIDEERLQITALGKAFLRNICMIFDQKLRLKNRSGEELFSKSI